MQGVRAAGVRAAVDPATLRAARLLHEAMAAGAREAGDGLTPVQLSGLRVVAAVPTGATVAQVADELGVAASNASRLVDRLVAFGVVHRERARADRREVRVTLSGAGRRLLEAIDAVQVVHLHQAVAAMPAAERAALLAALGGPDPVPEE